MPRTTVRLATAAAAAALLVLPAVAAPVLLGADRTTEVSAAPTPKSEKLPATSPVGRKLG